MLLRFLLLCSVSALVGCSKLAGYYSVPEVLVELDKLKKIHFHQVQFDPSRITNGLTLRNLFSVESISLDVEMKTCSGIDGWTSGRHYFQFQIEKGGKDVYFGVYDWSVKNTFIEANVPGRYSNDGIAYGGENGMLYYEVIEMNIRLGPQKKLVSQNYGPELKTNDIVGVYLDLDIKSISFFVNGKLLGSGLQLKSDVKYYPFVSIRDVTSKLNSLPIAFKK
jgi:SPRY domain